MINKLVTAILCMTILFAMLPVYSQQEQTAEEKEMMKKWQSVATPGENHKFMAGKAGNWNAKVTSWAKPGAEPEKTTAVAKSEMILGGRYLYTEHSGTMMGMPFEGRTISCYDNYKKQFETLWIDNMGTGFYLTQGNLEEGGKILKETGLWDDFMTGKKMEFKSVSTTIDDNSFTFEMFMKMPDGSFFKTLEMHYTRTQ